MSGGAYEYAYIRVQEFKDALLRGEDYDGDKQPVDAAQHPEAVALRQRFAEHLRLVGDAMYAIEWTDSGDAGFDQERAAIEACLADRGKASP